MRAPVGPLRSPWRAPTSIPPSPSPFLLPGSSNPLARSPGPPQGAFLHLLGLRAQSSIPLLPPSSSQRWRNPTRDANSGTRTPEDSPPTPPPKKKGLRRLQGALRSPPTAKMLQCWRSGPTRRTERSRGGRGKKGLLRDSACVLTCRRSGCSSETCLPAPFFSRNTASPPPRPGPGPGVECNIL